MMNAHVKVRIPKKVENPKIIRHVVMLNIVVNSMKKLKVVTASQSVLSNSVIFSMNGVLFGMYNL